MFTKLTDVVSRKFINFKMYEQTKCHKVLEMFVIELDVLIVVAAFAVVTILTIS